MSQWKYPGQYEWDGLVLSEVHSQADLVRIRDELEMFAGDVVTASCCRTGTTWVNEIIFMILNRGDEDKLALPAYEKVVFLENPQPPGVSSVDVAQSRAPPRVLKTHLPVRYVKRNLDKGADGPKAVVIARNPKDMLVSWYHFIKTNPCIKFPGDWDEYFETFREKRLQYCDFFEYYSEWMVYRDNPNVYFVYYEDLVKKPEEEVAKLARFLGMDLSEDELRKVLTVTSFDSMRAMFVAGDPRGMGCEIHQKTFIRKGKVGGWKGYFSEEQSRFVDERYEEVLKPTGMTFQYD